MPVPHGRLWLRTLGVAVASYLLTSLVYGIFIAVNAIISDTESTTLLEAFGFPLCFGLLAPAVLLPLPDVASSMAEYRLQNAIAWISSAAIWLLFYGAIYAGLAWATRRNWKLKQATIVAIVISTVAYAICFKFAWISWDEQWTGFISTTQSK